MIMMSRPRVRNYRYSSISSKTHFVTQNDPLFYYFITYYYYLFNAAELLAAMGPLSWPPHWENTPVTWPTVSGSLNYPPITTFLPMSLHSISKVQFLLPQLFCTYNFACSSVVILPCCWPCFIC